MISFTGFLDCYYFVNPSGSNTLQYKAFIFYIIMGLVDYSIDYKIK